MISSYMDDFGKDQQLISNHSRGCSLESLSQPETCSLRPPENISRGRSQTDSSLLQGGNVSKETEDEMLPRNRAELIPQQSKHLDSGSGINAWRRWIQWREAESSLGFISSSAGRLKAEILECSSSELSDGLCLFIKDVKQLQGDAYPPDSLFYLCLSIQQYLFENNRLVNIFTDLNYQKFSSELTRILKCFQPSLPAPRFLSSCVEEEFLWGSKQLGAYSPIVLLNTLIYFCCKNFGLTTVEQHRRLSFTCFRHRTRTSADNTQTTFLRFYPPESRHDAETGPDGVPAKKRRLKENFLEVKENLENPLRCPVRLYEFYLSKCSESVKQRRDVFYLQPDERCLPSSPFWFSLMPLDGAMMEAAIVRSLAVRELQDKLEGRKGSEPSGNKEQTTGT